MSTNDDDAPRPVSDATIARVCRAEMARAQVLTAALAKEAGK